MVFNSMVMVYLAGWIIMLILIVSSVIASIRQLLRARRGGLGEWFIRRSEAFRRHLGSVPGSEVDRFLHSLEEWQRQRFQAFINGRVGVSQEMIDQFNRWVEQERSERFTRFMQERHKEIGAPQEQQMRAFEEEFTQWAMQQGMQIISPFEFWD